MRGNTNWHPHLNPLPSRERKFSNITASGKWSEVSLSFEPVTRVFLQGHKYQTNAGLGLSAKLTRCAFLIVFLAYACSNSTTEIPFHEDGKNVRTVFVAHDSWHSAVVIKRADIPVAVLPEVKDFPGAELMEFSWGDRDYFPAPDPGFGLALKAAFWSKGSILHVVGFNDTVENVFPGAEIIEIHLSEEAFRRLIKFIADTFSRLQPTVPAEARPGLFPNGRFYFAEGKFSILRTCNTWVAEALSSAGLPISPGCVITANSLGNQVRPFGARGQDRE